MNKDIKKNVKDVINLVSYMRPLMISAIKGAVNEVESHTIDFNTFSIDGICSHLSVVLSGKNKYMVMDRDTQEELDSIETMDIGVLDGILSSIKENY